MLYFLCLSESPDSDRKFAMAMLINCMIYESKTLLSMSLSVRQASGAPESVPVVGISSWSRSEGWTMRLLLSSSQFPWASPQPAGAEIRGTASPKDEEENLAKEVAANEAAAIVNIQIMIWGLSKTKTKKWRYGGYTTDKQPFMGNFLLLGCFFKK